MFGKFLEKLEEQLDKKPEFRVPVTHIRAINPHPNPKVERLEIATVFDFNVVVRKNQYKVGDTVVYVPIDSILPPDLEAKIFGPNSKIKLTKSRVRQIRIQQFASQGMLISTEDVMEYLNVVRPNFYNTTLFEEGENLAEDLDITKYEPPAPDYQANLPKAKKERNKIHENNFFHQYNGLENAKWYPDLFTEGEEVVYTEKIHGSNGRAGLLPATPRTLWEKIKKYFGKFPEYQFCYGSNTVQLQSKGYTGFYKENVYNQMVEKYDLKNKLKPNETVYYEIYGGGIQKNYHYGLEDGERAIVVFDVKVHSEDGKSWRFLKFDEMVEWCEKNNLPTVPVLYRGPHSKELAKQHTLGDSVLAPSQKIREGIVIKDPNETSCYYGKKYLKLLSEEYLDRDDVSDFH